MTISFGLTHWSSLLDADASSELEDRTVTLQELLTQDDWGLSPDQAPTWDELLLPATWQWPLAERQPIDWETLLGQSVPGGMHYTFPASFGGRQLYDAVTSILGGRMAPNATHVVFVPLRPSKRYYVSGRGVAGSFWDLQLVDEVFEEWFRFPVARRKAAYDAFHDHDFPSADFNPDPYVAALIDVLRVALERHLPATVYF